MNRQNREADPSRRGRFPSSDAATPIHMATRMPTHINTSIPGNTPPIHGMRHRSVEKLWLIPRREPDLQIWEHAFEEEEDYEVARQRGRNAIDVGQLDQNLARGRDFG